MAFPTGLPTKTLTFGRYSAALGTNVSGSISVKFDDPMLHLPTGEVVTTNAEVAQVDPATGSRSITVPITVTDDLVANWRSEGGAYVNQRLRVEVKIPGYLPSAVSYVDIHPDDSATIDFDQLERYAAAGGTPILRAAVTSVVGLGGAVTGAALAAALGPYMPTGGGVGIIDGGGPEDPSGDTIDGGTP